MNAPERTTKSARRRARPQPGADGDALPATMSIRNRTLSYRHRPGTPGRVPLVLCNGIGASMDVLEPLAAELHPERPVIRFDVPGIGASPQPRMLGYR